ncbi:MAG: FKBP-type peptidyl-prolyl cis-trans isomerase [Bacteroidales bacterium]|nr:FKBP-type peptidyl-prolyl cis-trans isomerase [Bacteroidales bacterium]
MKSIVRSIIIASIVLLVGLNYSCEKNQDVEDREIIEKYISDHDLAAVELDNTGLFYVIENKGGNLHPTVNSTVTVNYKGVLINGNTFDSQNGIKFSLQSTIVGWKLGIPLIGESGKIKLIIPSAMAYGSRSVGDIPENSVLIFDIDLLLFN